MTRIIGRTYYQDDPVFFGDYVGPGALPINLDAAVRSGPIPALPYLPYLPAGACTLSRQAECSDASGLPPDGLQRRGALRHALRPAFLRPPGRQIRAQVCVRCALIPDPAAALGDCSATQAHTSSVGHSPPRSLAGIVLGIMIVGAICQSMSFGRNAKAVVGTLCWWRFMLGVGIGGGALSALRCSPCAFEPLHPQSRPPAPTSPTRLNAPRLADYPLSATIMSEYSSRLSRGAFVSAVFAQQARDHGGHMPMRRPARPAAQRPFRHASPSPLPLPYPPARRLPHSALRASEFTLTRALSRCLAPCCARRHASAERPAAGASSAFDFPSLPPPLPRRAPAS